MSAEERCAVRHPCAFLSSLASDGHGCVARRGNTGDANSEQGLSHAGTLSCGLLDQQPHLETCGEFIFPGPTPNLEDLWGKGSLQLPELCHSHVQKWKKWHLPLEFHGKGAGLAQSSGG